VVGIDNSIYIIFISLTCLPFIYLFLLLSSQACDTYIENKNKKVGESEPSAPTACLTAVTFIAVTIAAFTVAVFAVLSSFQRVGRPSFLDLAERRT
jgi:hypothetical protein